MTTWRAPLGVLGLSALIVGASFLRLPDRVAHSHSSVALGHTQDLAAYSAAAPEKPLNLLFIHHSCGGQWLAQPGEEVSPADCIHVSHPNGGGLRALLQQQGYTVHEASYGSEVGQDTDLLDWPAKFRDKMSKLLSIEENDRTLPSGQTNPIVVFKSCFTNSAFEDDRTPATAGRRVLTVARAKQALLEVREALAQYPQVLFVYVTAPPLAPKVRGERVLRYLWRRIHSGRDPLQVLEAQASRARSFNDWVKSPAGWLNGYPHSNIAVFDYYDQLTDDGKSDLSSYPTQGGYDSHPSREGNQKASQAFVPFLNRAVRRAGLAP